MLCGVIITFISLLYCSLSLHPAVQALRHRPYPFVNGPLPVRLLHVDLDLHREHVRRVHPALHPPPDYDVPRVSVLEGIEDEGDASWLSPTASSTSGHSPITRSRRGSKSYFSFTFAGASSRPSTRALGRRGPDCCREAPAAPYREVDAVKACGQKGLVVARGWLSRILRASLRR